jgi:glycerol uptake facilitator-like aquaporin
MYEYLAEFLGSAIFVYSVLATGNPLIIGGTLALVLILTQKISGGHINPCISIVMGSIDKLPISEIIPYALSQIFGALVALELYKRFKLQ